MVTPLAILALVLFVPFSAVLYAILRPPTATATVLVSAVMFLPEHVAFDPPGLPPLDKHTISGLCALLGATATSGRRLLRARPGRGVEYFALALLLGCLGTALTNRDPIIHGGGTLLPSLRPYDALSDAVRLLLSALIPFFLGRALVRSSRDMRSLFVVLVTGALVYIPFILFEIRLSPQLHRMLYGFHQHEFIQTLRGGGYRPMVFMHHGLAVAMFVFTAALAAVTLARARMRVHGLPAGPVALALVVLLVGCKSFGALVYGLLFLPLLYLVRPRRVLTVATAIVGLILAYPSMRSSKVIPTDGLVDLAARVSQERADSLAFRFYHEDRLVARALERPLFGWGGFSRSRVFNEWGQDVSVTDGFWVIILGKNGVVGFVGMFGLLLGPILMARRRIHEVTSGHDRVLLAGLSTIAAVQALELLPNALYSHLPMFLAGSLAGLASGLPAEARARRLAWAGEAVAA